MGYEIARRTPRYRFVVDIEVADVQSRSHIKARTTTLSQFGCGVDTSKPLPQGTGVKIKLSHRGAEVKAVAIVVYASPELGMGISFIEVDRESERILDLWIEELMSMPVQK